MVCSVCHSGHITRAHKKVICNSCYRETCFRCGEPILLNQSARKTSQGLIHLGVCPAERKKPTMEIQWEQLGLPLAR